MNEFLTIFTDLDGTLLDHNDYSYIEATSCLDFIRNNNIPLIFTSSKTSIEIELLCNEANIFHPYIAENGAILGVPVNYFDSNTRHTKNYKKLYIGLERSSIKTALKNLAVEFKFKAFSDFSISEIIRHTGLNELQAKYANQRECTEPIIWEDSQVNFEIFLDKLNSLDMSLIKGGRFHHVMGQHDKARTMLLLIKKFREHMKIPIKSIALGDSPNDYAMLKSADYGVLIPNSHSDSQSATIDQPKTIIYANHEGPKGWNETLLKLLKELTQ